MNTTSGANTTPRHCIIWKIFIFTHREIMCNFSPFTFVCDYITDVFTTVDQRDFVLDGKILGNSKSFCEKRDHILNVR